MTLQKPGFFYSLITRLIDLVLGSVLLLLSTPVILLAAIAIRLESKGNPFFVQKRVGYRRKPFNISKLRGMYVDSVERFPHLYDYSKHDNLDFYFHAKRDPRITKVGSFIRRTSIDELPNFLNVVLGQMSLVGPRPEVPEVEVLYGSYSEQYFSVKPGVTCLSKITGRDALTKVESIKMDIDYVNCRCLSLDLQILWRTAQGVLLRKQVYAERETPELTHTPSREETSVLMGVGADSD